MDRCTSCHTYERIAKSTYNADEFIKVLQRMATYAPGTTPLEPHKRKETRAVDGPGAVAPARGIPRQHQPERVETWDYPLKTLPRLKGRSTKVVFTEYDLPRPTAMPHDVILDGEGMAWYTDFGHQYLGKLDPKTGKVTEYTVPTLKADYPPGMLDIEIDKKGDLWIGMMLQAGIAKFDRKAETFTMYPLPQDINNPASQQAMVMPLSSDVGRQGLDEQRRHSGRASARARHHEVRDFCAVQEHAANRRAAASTGIKADSKNNLFFMDFSSEFIGRIDAKTGQTTFFKTPTPNSIRGAAASDPQDRLWFTEYRAEKIAMFDTKTDRFTEWSVPAYSWPYDVMPDKNGELWTAGMSNDRVVRLDPKSGQVTEYQFPRNTNVRRVWVDNSTTPVTFWVGGNHSASIVKVEPLD